MDSVEPGPATAEASPHSPPGRGERLADVLIGLAALPFVGLFLLAVTRIHGGLSASEIITFYVLPVLFVAGLLAARRLPGEVKMNLVLLGFVTFLSLGVAEVGIGFFQRAVRVRAWSEAGDRLTLAQRVSELRDDGIDAFPRIPGNDLGRARLQDPEGTRLNPLSPAPANVTVALCDEDGVLMTYPSDRYGFNNPDNVWDAPVDVVLIGDSYTHGVCVEADQTLAVSLRPQWNTANLGLSGAGPLAELAILREYASELRPPVVVWVYYEGNDASDLRAEAGRGWLTAYLDPSHEQGLVERAGMVDARYRQWIDSLMSAGNPSAGGVPYIPSVGEVASGALRLTSLRALLGVELSLPSAESKLGRLPDVLTRAKADVEAWGGRMLLVYLPTQARYRTRVGDVFQGREGVLAFADERGIPVLDLHPVFVATGDPRSLWRGPTSHLSPEGYRLVSDSIAAAIARVR